MLWSPVGVVVMYQLLPKGSKTLQHLLKHPIYYVHFHLTYRSGEPHARGGIGAELGGERLGEVP